MDEAAVLSCMAYVDLNPVRAGLTNQPEDSEFTSIKECIEQWRENRQSQAWLKPMKTGDVSDKSQGFIPFALADYLELVDWSGRAVREDKRCALMAISLFVQLAEREHYKYTQEKLVSAGCMDCMQASICLPDVFLDFKSMGVQTCSTFETTSHA